MVAIPCGFESHHQPLELKATEIAVEGISTPDYPLQKKRHSVEFLRTIQHLRPRTNLFSATFRVRSATRRMMCLIMASATSISPARSQKAISGLRRP